MTVWFNKSWNMILNELFSDEIYNLVGRWYPAEWYWQCVCESLSFLWTACNRIGRKLGSWLLFPPRLASSMSRQIQSTGRKVRYTHKKCSDHLQQSHGAQPRPLGRKWLLWKCILRALWTIKYQSIRKIVLLYLPLLVHGFISNPRIGKAMWDDILELKRGSWRKRFRWIVRISGNSTMDENLTPFRNFLHFSQLATKTNS